MKKLTLTAALALSTAFTLSCDFLNEIKNQPEASCRVGEQGYTGEYIRFTDDRDSKEYKSVVIGTQTWMAENLNYEAEGSLCHDNDPAKCEEYGRLYEWETAMTACPSGWHLPTEDDFDILIVHSIEYDDDDSDKSRGRKLKSVSGWDEDCNGTDDFGFNALPGGSGYLGTNGPTFYSTGGYGHWWLATEYDAKNAYFYEMENTTGYLDKHHHPKTNSIFSVRCVKEGK